MGAKCIAGKLFERNKLSAFFWPVSHTKIAYNDKMQCHMVEKQRWSFISSCNKHNQTILN